MGKGWEIFFPTVNVIGVIPLFAYIRKRYMYFIAVDFSCLSPASVKIL